MSAFNFDPFAIVAPAKAPAPPPGAAPSTSSSSSGSSSGRRSADGAGLPPPAPAAIVSNAPPAAPALVIANPFDNFSFTSSNASGPGNNSANDWQQNARAAMANGSVWKSASSRMLGGGSSSQIGSASFQNSFQDPGAPAAPPRYPKRIVPYASHVSTLESNWDPWIHASRSSSPQSLWTNGGNFATYLVVRANDACRLSGGVEGVLKWSKSRPDGGSAMGVEAQLGNFDSTLSFSESQNDNGSSGINYGSAHSPISDGGSIASGGGRAKPLGSGGLGGGGGGALGGMRFLKSGLKKAQASFERSVTTMAIKADGGKNPDQLCVSLHYLGGMNVVNNGANPNGVNLSMWNALGMNDRGVLGGGIMQDVGDVCLSRTEWVGLPSAVNGSDGEGLLFSVPLCVPDLSFLEAAASAGGHNVSPGGSNIDGGVKLMIRLYLRSGATLLKAVANAGLKREYCIGESALLYSNLMRLMNNDRGRGRNQQQHQQSASDGAFSCGTINMPFTTGMLAETSNAAFDSFGSSGSIHSSGGADAPASLHITATPRVKFNPPCTFGWSLSDPISKAPVGPKNWLKMFQLPLDQAYVFNLVHHHQLLNSNQQYNRQLSEPNSAVLLANERAVESALVLPLATACSLLFSSAASRSQTLAQNASTKTRSKEALYLPPPAEETRTKPVVDSVVMNAMIEGCADVELGVVALVLLGEETQMNFGLLSGCGVGFESAVPSVKTTLSFQPPYTIFEESLGSGSCPVLDEAAGTRYINSLNGPTRPKEAISARFLPRILTEADGLLPGVAGSRKNGRYLGSVRLEMQVGYTNSAVDNISAGISGGTAVEGLVELEHYMDAGTGGGGCGQVPVLSPAIDASAGRRIGTFVLLLRVANANNNNRGSSSSQTNKDASPSASSGLVSAVGLSTLTEDLGLAPHLDCDPPSPNSQPMASPPTAAGMRRRQVATMGSFVGHRFLEHLANVVRKRDAGVLKERYEEYYRSLSETVDVEGEEDTPLFKRRAPRPFRPSNSRGDALLSGLGFNVHVQSLALNMLQEDGSRVQQVAVTQSVTHGAPADHAGGFGGRANEDGSPSAGDSSKDGAPRGGLRRLESGRLEMARELDESVTGLISAVGDHFKSCAQASANRQQAGVRPNRHVPSNLPAIIHYRTKSVECAQRLHSLTWDVAVRRANCFSQALGIAVTSYLASLSDGGPAWRGYAGIWARHGYLITFEGLLSSVGKELGMIEDASVSISMLRMLSIVLMPDDPNSKSNAKRQRIPVPHSPYLRWVYLTHLTTPHNELHWKTHYRLEIGLDPSYYQSRVPDPLKNGTAVRFFPILFQMGVDIRQWGVNAGRSVAMIPMKDKRGNADLIGDAADIPLDTSAREVNPTTSSGNGGSLLDDEEDDDEEGEDSIPDNEILMALNVEGYRKLNAYAHSTYPTVVGATAASASPPVFDWSEQPSQMQVPQQQPIHPSLVPLSEAIRTSAGKMEHAVLDRAATACQRFGGGSTVFCKSGKDRTAMQVTFKQSQFVQRFIDKKKACMSLEDVPISYEEVFEKSTLMRKHGNRIPICEKNAGEPKFAFNPLQRKFMPEMLRPEASLCTWSKPET